jgi:hypothetical protein
MKPNKLKFVLPIKLQYLRLQLTHLKLPNRPNYKPKVKTMEG